MFYSFPRSHKVTHMPAPRQLSSEVVVLSIVTSCLIRTVLPPQPQESLAISKETAYSTTKLLAMALLSILHNWKMIATLNFAFLSPYLGLRRQTSEPSSGHYSVTAAAPYVK